MFGHQSDNDKKDTNNIPDESIDGALGDKSDQVVEPDHSDQASTTAETQVTPVSDSDTPGDDSAAPAATPDPSPAEASDDQAWQHPGAPLDDTKPISDVISPAGGYPKTQTFPQANHSNNSIPSDPPSDTSDPATDKLIGIKQHALTELAPFIDDLDLGPEEKFRTIMMIIQASDDRNLVDKAYEAAHTIEDEKIRAGALLDIVNEVNYFTQPPATEE